MNWSYMIDVLEDTWFLQNVTVFASFLLTGVLIALLARFNNTPILEWNGISLNAVVALIATILKGLVALTVSDCLGQAKWIWLSWQERSLSDFAFIDQGSRGPLGSIKLLWWKRPMSRSFISYGAILVILSVPMDSFIQLAVGKTNAMVYKNDSSAQISYATRYSKGNFTGSIGIEGTVSASGESEIESNASASADLSMSSAFFQGLTQPDTLVAQQTKHNCPSGNCTWDNFQSLAVCSACTDLTDRLSKISVPFITQCYGRHINLTVYRLPNGLGLTNLRGEDPVEWMTGFGTGNESQSISFGSKDTLIWSMTIIRLSNTEVVWPRSPVTAAECGLWYCVRNYDSMVRDGNLVEFFSPAPSMRSHDSWQSSRSLPPPYWENSSGNLSFGILSVETVTDLQLGGRFNVSDAAVYGISNLMNTTFTRSSDDDDENQAANEMNYCSNDSGGNNAVLFKGSNALYGCENNHTFFTSTAMPYLFHSQDLNATFATLAKSMTNNIRENSDGNLVMTGKTGTLHVVYQIHWNYLILPIFLVVANAAFLVIVIYYSRKSGLAVLCSSAIPTVDLGGRIGPVFNKVRLRSRMEEAAKLQQVRFISVPKEKQNSDDVEGFTASHEDDGVTASSQEGDGVSSLHGADGHEMVVLMGTGDENQDNARRRSYAERSIVSPISLDSRSA